MTTITSQLSNHYQIILKVTQSSQNITNNTSLLSWTYQISCGSAYYQNSSTKDTFKAVINGTTVLNVNKAISFSGPNTTITIASGTLNVSHNTDGTKTVNMSCSYTPGRSASYYPSSMNANGTMKLTSIPRKSTISTNIDSQYPDKSVEITVSKASSSFTHTLKYSCGQLSGTIATKTTDTTLSWKIPASFINQNPNATQLCTLTCITYNGSTNIGSATKTLTIQNYEESTISHCSGNMIGEMMNLTIDRQYSGLTHQLKYSFGNQKDIFIASSATDSAQFLLPLDLCNEIPNSVSGNLTVQLITYYDSIVIGNIKYYSYLIEVPSSVSPTFKSVNHNEGDENIKALALGAYVQHKSKLSLSIEDIYAGMGATINSYKIEVAGQTIKDQSGITGVITKSGHLDIKATIINSRGQSYSKTLSEAITILPYTPPTLHHVTGGRDDDTTASISASIAAQSIQVNNVEKNIVKYLIKYDANSAHDISELFEKEISKNLTIQIPNLDKTKSYQVKVYVGDIFGFINTYELLTIPTGNVGIDFDTKSGRVAIGKYFEADSNYNLETAKSIYSRDKILSESDIYSGGNISSDGYIKPKGGQYIHEAHGTSGTGGYVKVAQFKIKGAWANKAIILGFIRRGDQDIRELLIRFAGSSGYDPSVEAFYSKNETTKIAFLHKSATSTWDLYITKEENYGDIGILYCYADIYVRERIDITWLDEHSNSLPSGYIQTTRANEYINNLFVGNTFSGGGSGSGTQVSEGYIEMYGATPYIDFHYNNSTSDYTARIIEDNNGALTITPALRVAGWLSTGSTITLPNDVGLYGRTTSGGTMLLTDVSASNNCVFGYGAYTAGTRSTLYGGRVQLVTGNGAQINFEKSDNSTYNGFFYPNTTNKTTLGMASYRFYRLYSSLAVDVSSDIRLKQNIRTYDDRYEKLFDNLKPVIYDRADLNSKGHLGLIAQWTKEAMNQAKISDEEFALYHYEAESDDYSICYEELAPLNTWQIQKVKGRVNQIENTISIHEDQLTTLQNQYTELQNKYASLEAKYNQLLREVI